MAENELKPCPFCGGEAEICESMHKGRFIVRCKDSVCHFTYKPENIPELICWWNRRAD